MGLLDIPGPLLGWLDALMSVLPSIVRLVIWAVLASILTMLSYWAVSAQDRIASVKQDAISARRALANYEGTEFDEVWPLSLAVLSHSGRHFLIVLWPAVAGSLPVLFVLVWLSNAYSFALPEAGETVSVSVNPPSVNAIWRPTEEPGDAGTYTLEWPAQGQSVTLADSSNAELLSLPLPAPVPEVHQRRWWNTLIGNPAGYIPKGSEIEAVEFDLPELHYLSFGPNWMRSWEATFFSVLVICSVGIKVVFKIH